MLCGWKGNRRSGIALAIRHRLSGISTYRLNGLGKGDEHPYAPLEHGTFTLQTHPIMLFPSHPYYLRLHHNLYPNNPHIVNNVYCNIPLTSVLK